MESAQATQGSRPKDSCPTTLNEVLHAEMAKLRPSLLSGIEPSKFPKYAADETGDAKAQRTDNLRKIYGRIASLGIGSQPDEPGSEPLSALCLSGGGIRSATFNLGVLQGLARIGLLGKFDYLSSVSGGGYIAAWFKAWMHRENNDVVELLKNDGSQRNPLAPEPQPLVNLREYSNYLTPKLGLFSGDTWAAAGIIVRNLLLNWLVVIPLLAAVIGISLLILLVVRGPQTPEAWNQWLLRMAVCIELIASLLVYIIRRLAKGQERSQAFFIFGCVLPVCVAGAVLCTAGLGLKLPWRELEPHPSSGELSGLLKFTAVWCIAVPVIGWCAAELLARLFPVWTETAVIEDQDLDPSRHSSSVSAASRQVAPWWEFFALLISGLVGMALLVAVISYWFPFLYNHPALYVVLGLPIVLGIYLFCRVLFVGIASLSDTSKPDTWRVSSDDADREWWARVSGWILLVIVVWLAVTGVCLLGSYIPNAVAKLFKSAPREVIIAVVKYLLAAIGAASGIAAAFVGSSAKTPATINAIAPVSRSRKWLVDLAGPVFAICVIIVISWEMKSLGQWVTGDSRLFWFSVDWTRDLQKGTVSWGVLASFSLLILGLAALAFVAGCVVNVNRFSLHGMYRNRLVRAYLGASNCSAMAGKERQPDPFTGFALDDNLPLHTLCPLSPLPGKDIRPLPIINTTLNLVDGKNLAWQQRKAESFAMTPLYCGSWCEGYRPSTEYGGPGGITIGTAITISGAAVNPNMGYSSSPALAFLMGIFNVRLGAWLGNTNRKGNSTYNRPGPRQAIMPLFAEIFGLTNSSRRYVNLSDGGHFDNLGLYEVVLRRCRHVLVCDAGQDGSFAFEDLGNAIRKIRIDFGIRIVFENKIKIRPNEPDKPGLYCAIARICYSDIDGDVEDGELIYIKPTLRGRIPTDKGHTALSSGEGGGDGEGIPYDIYSYARSSTEFPHESTVDQWFSESQFESYRALGFHILEQLGGTLEGARFVDFLASARRCVTKPQVSPESVAPAN